MSELETFRMNEMPIIIKQKEVMSLMNTSVSDAEITLKNMLKSDPIRAEGISLMMLDKLKRVEGQKSRKQLASKIIRLAKKAISSK